MSRPLTAALCAAVLLASGSVTAASTSTAAAATLRVTAAPLQVWERPVSLDLLPSTDEASVGAAELEEVAGTSAPEEDSTPELATPAPVGAGGAEPSGPVRPPAPVPDSPEPDVAPSPGVEDAPASRAVPPSDVEELLAEPSDG